MSIIHRHHVAVNYSIVRPTSYYPYLAINFGEVQNDKPCRLFDYGEWAMCKPCLLYTGITWRLIIQLFDQPPTILTWRLISVKCKMTNHVVFLITVSGPCVTPVSYTQASRGG